MEWREAKEWLKDSNIPCTNCDELDCGGLCSTKEAVDTLVEIVEKVEELRDIMTNEMITLSVSNKGSAMVGYDALNAVVNDIDKILKGEE